MKYAFLVFTLFSYIVAQDKTIKTTASTEKITKENLFSFGRGVKIGTYTGLELMASICFCRVAPDIFDLFTGRSRSYLAQGVLFLGLSNIIFFWILQNAKQINNELIEKNKDNKSPLLSDMIGMHGMVAGTALIIAAWNILWPAKAYRTPFDRAIEF